MFISDFKYILWLWTIILWKEGAEMFPLMENLTNSCSYFINALVHTIKSR